MFDKLKIYAKAAGAFVAAFAGFAVTLLASPELRAVFPSGVIAFLTAVAAAGALGAVVAGIPNKITPEQVIKSGIDVGVVVGAEVAKQAGAAAADVIKDAAVSLPSGAGDLVIGVSKKVEDTVNSVINDLQRRAGR